jgi:cytochrome c peroxidase
VLGSAGWEQALTSDEVAGLRLFIGRAQCIKCHNGPLFTNNDFHNTGVPAEPGLPADDGRLSGVAQVLEDEFNCLSPWSDAGQQDCAELWFVTPEGDQLQGAFKPPTLRNGSDRSYASRNGQLKRWSGAGTAIILPRRRWEHSELEPLGLTSRSWRSLRIPAALTAASAATAELLQAPKLDCRASCPCGSL